MEQKKTSFYALDFLKTLLNPKKIPIVIYLLVDMLFLYCGVVLILGVIFENNLQVLNYSLIISAVISVVVYLIAIVLSLSEIGEWVNRTKLKCNEITSVEILNRVEPLFNEVYEKAKIADPSISNNIKLFINEYKMPNAFALGRNTICISQGALDLSDEQIKALLGHEFGHLANKDTDLNLVLNVANSFINIMFAFAWAMIFVVKFIGGIINLCLKFSKHKIAAIVSDFTNTIFTFLLFISIRLAQNIWNGLGILLIRFADRDGEYRADEFSYNLGYGKDLIKFFQGLPDSQKGSSRKISQIFDALATIGASHPATWKRIERLENLMHSPEIETISESDDDFNIISESE